MDIKRYQLRTIQNRLKVTESQNRSFSRNRPKLKNKLYRAELAALHLRLVKLQRYIRAKGLRVCVLFEGRDAAGKGGAIKRITQPLNPRVCRVVALDKPDSRQRSQWFFQRYVAHLPSAGELVLFDRSWYNRSGVERVMGFCSDSEYREFLRSCPIFESLLIKDGIYLIKYWFSVSKEEQTRRLQRRIDDPVRRWKISTMDLQSRSKWSDYSRAKDVMLSHTDTRESPWWIVDSDNKKRARLNCIHHLLSLLPFEEVTPPPIELPPIQEDEAYHRTPFESQRWIPEIF